MNYPPGLRSTENSVISNNIDEPKGHYNTWNEPGTERQKLKNLSSL